MNQENLYPTQNSYECVIIPNPESLNLLEKMRTFFGVGYVGKKRVLYTEKPESITLDFRKSILDSTLGRFIDKSKIKRSIVTLISVTLIISLIQTKNLVIALQNTVTTIISLVLTVFIAYAVAQKKTRENYIELRKDKVQIIRENNNIVVRQPIESIPLNLFLKEITRVLVNDEAIVEVNNALYKQYILKIENNDISKD